MKFIDLSKQYSLIKNDVNNKIQSVLNKGQYILGDEVKELELRLANYVGVKHCIGVSSGTDALLISLMALDICPGDEIITTAFSFIATAEVIALLGASPKFIDIDPRTYNLDPALIEEAITPKTKAIIAVSLYGQCADINYINKIASKYSIPVIEDAAQSFGATIHGKRSCSLSTIGCTSFFPSKPLGCYGDGGAVFTNNDVIASKIRQIRIHGQDARYHHARLGICGRLDTLQAAILLAKLEIFDEEIDLRINIAKQYKKALNEINIKEPHIQSGNTSIYAQYTVQIENRDSLQEKLKKLNVPTAVHYPFPLYKQPALLQKNTFLPNTESVCKKVMSLPMHPYLNRKDIEFIVQALSESI